MKIRGQGAPPFKNFLFKFGQKEEIIDWFSNFVWE
jgi:hypothetical protein